MKKNSILSMAVAYTMLVVCSSDEIVGVDTGSIISFHTLVNIATRTNQEATASLSAFKVTTVKDTGTEFTATVTKNGSEWSTAETYYQLSYALKSYAYANGPAAEKGRVSITKDAKTITDFTPAGGVTEHKDLLMTYNTDTRGSYNSSPVPLTLRHTLSQIEVKIKNEKAGSAKVEIIGVKLVNMATKATLTFPESTLNNTKLPVNNWSSQTNLNIPSEACYSNGTKTVVLNSIEFQSVMFDENNFMVILQQIIVWNIVKNDPDAEISKRGAYLAVLYRIPNLSETGETLIYPTPAADDPRADKCVCSAMAVNTKTTNQWEPSRKYVYNLTFCSDGGSAGKVDPNPENPGGNSDTNETPGTGGEGTLGDPIKFSIAVEDWETVEVLIDM